MTRRAIIRSLAPVALCLFVSGCDGVQPQRVTATGTLSGTDGLSRPSQETLVLTHNVGEPATARLLTRQILIHDVTGFNLAVTRTGVPIDETFILVSLSRTATAPGSSAPEPTVIAEARNFVADHLGQLVSLSVDTARLDSTLTATRGDLFPGRQRTTFTMMARWEADDTCMPFSDANHPIDFSRFQDRVFLALTDVVARADAGSDAFRLGGSGDDGDFHLYFVPYTQHSTLVDFGMPRNGFTLIFKATIIAGLVEAQVYVPLSILFSRLPGTGGAVSLDGSLDLIQLGTSSDDRGRVTVIADGIFEEATGAEIRQRILDSVRTMPPAILDTLNLAMGAFSALLNSLRPNGGNGPLSENARVVLFPGIGPQPSLNRLLPSGFQPTLCILD